MFGLVAAMALPGLDPYTSNSVSSLLWPVLTQRVFVSFVTSSGKRKPPFGDLVLLRFRVSGLGITHRSLSSSFWGLPDRILNVNHNKELLRGLWVGTW